MKKDPGSVSASLLDSPEALPIMILSGGGPFTHVRASDADGNIVETNKKGVFELSFNEGEGKFDVKPRRLTFVTKAYVGGQTSGMRVGDVAKEYGRNGWGSYFAADMCVGSSAKVNPAYTPRSPNGLFPWGLKHTHLYY